MSFVPAVPRCPTAKISRKRAQAKRIQSTGGSRPHRDRRPEARSCFVFFTGENRSSHRPPAARTKRTKGTKRRTPRFVPFDANHPCIPSGPVPIRALPSSGTPACAPYSLRKTVTGCSDFLRHAHASTDRQRATISALPPAPSRRVGKGGRVEIFRRCVYRFGFRRSGPIHARTTARRTAVSNPHSG